MAKSQFKFDPEGMHYRELDDSLGSRVWRIVIYIFGILVLAVILNVAYSLFFDTPRERQIRKENEQLQDQYNALSQRKQQVDTVMKEIEEIDKDIYRVIFETEPVDPRDHQTQRLAYANLLLSSSEDIVYYTAGKSDSLLHQNKRSSPHYDMLLLKGTQKEDMLAHIPGIQPIDNPELNLLASGYGIRIHPIYKIAKMHEGVDFAAPVGTPVKVTGDGQVIEVIRSGRGLGNRILVDHGYGYRTLYACLDEIQTRRGRTVKRGDVIGTVGESGLSVAPHLHYEVQLNGEQVNPINYFFLELSPRDYDELILTSMNSGQSFD